MISNFLILLFGILLGLILFPTLLFLRARRNQNWDNSNMTNMIRVLSHLATHPDDFAKFKYCDCQECQDCKYIPFWYLNKDEFSEVVKTRPIK